MDDFTYNKAKDIRAQIVKVRAYRDEVEQFLESIKADKRNADKGIDSPKIALKSISSNHKPISVTLHSEVYEQLIKILNDLWTEKDREANRLIDEFHKL